MENSVTPIPVEPQLPPVPADIDYSQEHAEAIKKGHIKLACLAGAALLINVLDMSKGDIMALTNQPDAAPVTDGVSISQEAPATYASGDILADATQHETVSEHHSDEKEERHQYSMDLSELLANDTSRFAEIARKMKEENTSELPEDFPTKKLPMSITLDTPADAFKKKKDTPKLPEDFPTKKLPISITVNTPANAAENAPAVADKRQLVRV